MRWSLGDALAPWEVARRKAEQERHDRLGNLGAAHFRGKVVATNRYPGHGSLWLWRYENPRRWRWEVINTNTDVVVARDDGYGSRHEAMTDCAKEVLAVRNAWTRGYLRRRFL